MNAPNPYFDVVAGGVTVGSARVSVSPQHLDTAYNREQLVREFSWAIPNEDAIETICDHDPILEVGAGTGYWARLIYEHGGDVLATDRNAPVEPRNHPVWKADARSVVTNYPEKTLLMVWPSHGDSWATEALGAYGSADGDTLIYVGEGRTGVTADQRFHQMLFEEWDLTETVAIPTYLQARDRLEVWTRR